jgi:hypothetical protein
MSAFANLINGMSKYIARTEELIKTGENLEM